MNKGPISIKNRFHKFLGYVSLILIFILAASTVKNINRVIGIRKEVEKERQKVEKMKLDNEKLQVQINEAQEQEFIDKQIRNKLGLTKEGEAMVILPDETITRSLAPTFGGSEEKLSDPNWVKWKKLFL